MPKKLFGILTIILSILLFPAQSIAADFPDVPKSHLNYKAISYLQSTGVVKGYSDGSYGPSINLTRCEFLKIVMEASDVEPSNEIKHVFPDLDTSFWCNQYAVKAKEINVVKGDESGLFWPQRSISRIEALKLLFLLRDDDVGETTISAYFDVPLGSWFAPYVAKATSTNIIAGISPGLFGSDKYVNRSEMAEMMYRLLAIDHYGEKVYSPTMVLENGIIDNKNETESTTNKTYLITDSPKITLDNSPKALSGTIDNNFFEDISLDNDIPKTFILNEVYNFSGKVLSPSIENITIVLTENASDEQHITRGVVNDNQKFSIPVTFNIGGKLSIGMVPGLSGSYTSKEIVVVGEKDSANEYTGGNASNLQATINDEGNSIFSWNNQGKELSKIVFQQNSKQIIRIISGGINSYTPNYIDFKDFKQGEVDFAVFLASADENNAYSINSKWSKASETKNIDAVTHHFLEIDADNLDLTSSKLSSSTNKTIKISGKSTTNIRAEIAIVKTDGFVEEIQMSADKNISEDQALDKEIYEAPVYFNADVDVKEKGVYFVEVNASTGAAIYNSPIYVGGVIPLLPDFRDLEPDIPFITKSEVKNNLNTLKKDLLKLINDDRAEHGLDPVVLDDDLNEFAQAHSDDMAESNYFSHINKLGEGPSTRKLSFNIGTPVGENLAKARSLIAIQDGLMRSAIHRSTVLRDYWERVGLGITMDDDEHIIVVQEFSDFPYDISDLIKIKADLYNYINDERAKENLNETSINYLAGDIAENWSSSMINDNFFAFVNPNTQESLQENIQNSGFNKSFSSLILSGGDLDSLISNLENKENSNGTQIYADERWGQVSIGLAVSENGIEINATIIFLEE